MNNRITLMNRTISIITALFLLIPISHAESLGDLYGSMISLFSSEDESTTYAPGDTAVLDDYDIKLTNVMASNGGSQYKPENGNIYIILEFDITNKTDEQVFISSMMCFSPIVDDITYTISVEADAVAMFSGKMQFDAAIDPGKTQSGIVGYEIPEDWKEFKITVRPDFYSSDKAIFIVNQ